MLRVFPPDRFDAVMKRIRKFLTSHSGGCKCRLPQALHVKPQQALVIELFEKIIEFSLLLQLFRPRAHGLRFEREVHAFMLAVLCG
jgi:hypothetical protein